MTQRLRVSLTSLPAILAAMLAFSTPPQAAASDADRGRASGTIREINVHNPTGKDARIDFRVVSEGPIQYVRMGPGCGPVLWELLPVLRSLKAEGTPAAFEGKKLSERTICLDFVRL